ncbi:xanthine dehydrogenase family protein molybdopterin-binding subunit [Sphingobium sufflavum]|uniref:xanthine dehydrogenase family protein molybdopterin-binding subunit n=1 Tax=Sphingobium sufflavum TaxID=1129547 RepID=UPI003899AE57
MRVRKIGTGRGLPDTRNGAGATSRRRFLVGAAVTGGLALGWAFLPRNYIPRLNLAPGEQALGAFLKIDRAGQIIIIVPQAELGQGVYTVLPQVLADELGADWRTIAVQPALSGPFYANTLLVKEWLEGPGLRATGAMGEHLLDDYARRNILVLTGGSTSLAMFRQSYREAGAAARALLCKAAAARWDVAWESCDIMDGLVTDGTRTLRIGELVDEAVGFDVPSPLPLRPEREGDNRLIGTDAPRIDLPAKIDGSANFAADIRLPDMVFAAIRQGPVGALRLKGFDEQAARKVIGVLDVIAQDEWVAVTATNWWAANQALGRLDPVFETAGPPLNDIAILNALKATMGGGEGGRFFARGDLSAVFEKARIVSATYSVAPALHLCLEPMAVTARVSDAGAELWMPSQAPGLAVRAVADALGFAEDAVTLYPLFAGGSFGRKMEVDAAVQAALIARAAKAPVQLQWSRSEDIIHDRPRPPALAKMSAKLGRGGVIEGMLAKVAAPSALAQLWRRIGHGENVLTAIESTATTADHLAVSGLDTPYNITNYAVDHHPAKIALPTGRWRSNADHYSAFFRESFIDEVAEQAGVEPMSFRIQMLGGNPRLAHCLTTVAALGEWQGGMPGSGQGIACHTMAGASIAVLVRASLDGGRIRVPQIVAAVNCGAPVNPDIVRQQIEGGLIFGIAAALGGAGHYEGGMPTALQLGEMNLPRLADIGTVTVELIAAQEDQAGVGEIGVPAVAPALAGALHTLTGRRWRSLPFDREEG